MPTRSRGDVPAGTIRDLGLPERAVRALTRAGITRTDALALLTRRELAAVPGLGAGLIAAIRVVVPEPVPSAARSGVSPDARDEHLAVPEPAPTPEQNPAAPVMPSFDSLRGPRRRSAVDLLLPQQPPEQPAEPLPEPLPGPPVSARAAAVPRPPEYADLLLLGLRGVRAVVDVPLRVTRWWFREPVRCLIRLLGNPAGGDARPERR